MPSFILYSIIVLLVTIIVGCHQESCYVFDKEGSKHLGTKTPYRIVNNKDSTIKFKGCHAIKIIGIVRHGTRTPGQKVEQQMKTKLGRIRDEMNSSISYHGDFCEYDLRNIKKWKFMLANEGEKVLTREGEDEMIQLAKRFQNRFPNLLKENYSNDSFYFRFTDTQRTRESAKFFTKGLFGVEKSKNVWFPTPVYKDPILRFYKLCDKWRDEVKKNPLSLQELKKYLQTEEVERVVKNVSKRIGFDYYLSYEDVHLMYITCGFETAWYKSKFSVWCSVFSKEDLMVMEYAEELKYYWIDGYGYEINHRQACPLIKNVFSIIRSKDGPNSVFYFTHSGTILKTISYLGLYKDDYKLTHNINFNNKKNRKWKVSKVDSFSANLVFVLFRCNDNDLRVLLLHQERAVRIPGCSESELCPLEKFEQLFTNSFDGCDFTNLCMLKNKSD